MTILTRKIYIIWKYKETPQICTNCVSAWKRDNNCSAKLMQFILNQPSSNENLLGGIRIYSNKYIVPDAE